MNKYLAVSKLKSVRFSAENMDKAIEWVENHLDCSFEWLLAKVGNSNTI